jgi:hypothetical protein
LGCRLRGRGGAHPSDEWPGERRHACEHDSSPPGWRAESQPTSSKPPGRPCCWFDELRRAEGGSPPEPPEEAMGCTQLAWMHCRAASSITCSSTRLAPRCAIARHRRSAQAEHGHVGGPCVVNVYTRTLVNAAVGMGRGSSTLARRDDCWVCVGWPARASSTPRQRKLQGAVEQQEPRRSCAKTPRQLQSLATPQACHRPTASLPRVLASSGGRLFCQKT